MSAPETAEEEIHSPAVLAEQSAAAHGGVGAASPAGAAAQVISTSPPVALLAPLPQSAPGALQFHGSSVSKKRGLPDDSAPQTSRLGLTVRPSTMMNGLASAGCAVPACAFAASLPRAAGAGAPAAAPVLQLGALTGGTPKLPVSYTHLTLPTTPYV